MTRHHGYAGLADAAHSHALVRGVNHYGDAFRFENFLYGVGDLGGHALLDLKSLGIDLHHPNKLADAHDLEIGKIGHMGLSDNRRKVMFTVGFKTNVP
jgi:hypothetical protein